MSWVRVDDRFLEHRKVVFAARTLGAQGVGRISALWLRGMTYCNHYETDGYVPEDTVRGWVQSDKRPLEVADAMAERLPNGDSGLLERVEGGFRFHDYTDFQPSQEELELRRKKDRDRKRKGSRHRPGVPVPVGIHHGIRVDSNMESVWIPKRNPKGIRRDSACLPVPGTPVQVLPLYVLQRSSLYGTAEVQVHRAARGLRTQEPVENPKVLGALLWREVAAAYADPAEEFTISNVLERVKCAAARAGLVYSYSDLGHHVEVAMNRVVTKASA